MAMAGTNDNTSRIARSAALTLVISVAVLYLGDRFGILKRYENTAADAQAAFLAQGRTELLKALEFTFRIEDKSCPVLVIAPFWICTHLRVHLNSRRSSSSFDKMPICRVTCTL